MESRLYDRAFPLRARPCSLVEVIEITARLVPDKAALSYEDEAISFRALLEKMRKVAAFLVERGIRPGDRVALHLDNRPEFAYVAGGVLMAGGILVAMNVMYLEDEVRHILCDSGPKIVFALDKLAPRSMTARRELPGPLELVTVDSEVDGCACFPEVLY